MSIQPTLDGLEYRTFPGAEVGMDTVFEEQHRAIDDLYISLVVGEDYEPGDEGHFFAELFDIAVQQYEAETHRSIDDPTRERIIELIQRDCQLLAEYGFVEPLHDDKEERTK